MPISRKDFDQATLSEHDSILKSVEEYYRHQKLAVFLGKKIGRFKPDIIAIKSQNLTIAIEVKPNDANELRKGVGQCFSYMDWVHEVFLATSPKGIQLSNQLLRRTPIGIITATDGDITIVKEAERKEPENLKLTRLLSNTTGFCWICGRTFNMVEQAQRTIGGTYIAHREQEPTLFKALEQTLGKKIRTKGSWVPICVVCSRIIGNSIHEYITRLIRNVEFPTFDFDKLFLEEDRKLLKDFLEKKK